MKEYQVFYTDKWSSQTYVERKLKNFEMIDNHFNSPFGLILDIGCGKAYESREFNKKYNSELWLIEGNSKNNSQEVKSGKYHSSAAEFAQYFSLDIIKNQLDNLETKNYHLIDCNDISIPDSIKFDLITSYLSCGYHYPISTYKELILKHSHQDTKLVFDLRNRKGNLILEEGIEIVHEFYRHGSKYAMCQIKFKD
jgi:SAM-dependent methyltransferase